MKQNLPAKVEKDHQEAQLASEFNRSARYLAKNFGLDFEDIQNAYKGKRESLKLMDETVREAKSSRGENIAWTIVAAIFIPPLALWPGYYIWRNTQKIDTVKTSLKDEIYRQKLLEDQRVGIDRSVAPAMKR